MGGGHPKTHPCHPPHCKTHLIARPPLAAAVNAVEARVQPPALPEGAELIREAGGGGGGEVKKQGWGDPKKQQGRESAPPSSSRSPLPCWGRARGGGSLGFEVEVLEDVDFALQADLRGEVRWGFGGSWGHPDPPWTLPDLGRG